MKGSTGAGWAAAWIGVLAFVMALRGAGEAADVFGVAALGFAALRFLCRSIESLKEENRG